MLLSQIMLEPPRTINNLLLDDSGDVEWSSFQDTEANDKGIWKWGFGANSKISFPGGRDGKIRYRIFVPQKGAAINIYCNGRHSVRLAVEREGETVDGFIEVSRNDPPARVTLEFRIEDYESLHLFDKSGKFRLTFAFFELTYSTGSSLNEEECARLGTIKISGEISKTMCALPFQDLYISATGLIEPCCHTALNTSPREPIHAKDEKSLRKGWNSSLHRQLRREMALGREPEACSSCFRMEAMGAQSLRQYVNLGKEATLHESIKLMDTDGFMPFPPNGTDIRLGNTCNLKCRICYPHHSRNLIDEFSDYYGKDYSFLKNPRWPTTTLLTSVAKVSREGGRLHVAGGEPLITPEFLHLMEACVRAGAAESLSLRIITNLTHLRGDVLKLFNYFRDVQLTVSLDGPREINDYIRYPSQFSQIDKNLHYLSENMNKHNITHVRFNTTVQALNLFFLPGLFEYLAHFSMFDWVPNLSPIIEPEHLSIRILPLKVKERAQSILEAHVSRAEIAKSHSQIHRNLHQKAKGSVESLINYLFSKDQSHLLPEFYRFNKFLDDRRHQKPPQELQNILEEIFSALPV